MALLLVRPLKGISYIPMIEDYIATVFQLRHLPISRYIPEDQFKSLFPRVGSVATYVKRSKVVHGFIDPVTEKVMIHPDCVLASFRRAKNRLLKLKFPD